MNSCNGTLLRIDNVDLQMDMVLFDYIYPVLFTCTGNDGKLYIAVCYWANGDTKEWLIAETTPKRVIELLQDKITLRDPFLDAPLWQAILKRGEDFPTAVRVNADDIDQHCLPTAGEYMDADPGEFDEEIQALASKNSESEHHKRFLRLTGKKFLSLVNRLMLVYTRNRDRIAYSALDT